MLAGPDVVEAAAQELEGLVHRAVEQHVVIGHVEMAVVVDPSRLDPHHPGDEGGKNRRFEVETVEHGTILRWRPNPRPAAGTLACPLAQPACHAHLRAD